MSRLAGRHQAPEISEVVLRTRLYREALESSTVIRRFRVRLVSGEAEGI
ncbi:hypothetical protein [Microbulbifer epialgicus]|uniref:Uncharacterized protein n=1 Tax=Microbulbifer epialgicus TaxID=393907 RepID=A0ABV4NYJ9_9GAMM